MAIFSVGVVPLTNDDVINKTDTDELSDLLQALGDIDVLFAGPGIARGVVMDEDDPSCATEEG